MIIDTNRLDRPIIILGAPRSGTTILFRCLALHADLWHLPSESHKIFEGPFHPASRGYESNRVTAQDLTNELAQTLVTRFYRSAINLNRVWSNPALLWEGNSLHHRILNKFMIAGLGGASRFSKNGVIRFLEKTPKNALRVPMLNRLFPDAFYVWITRKATRNIDSLIASWGAVDKIGPLTRKRYGQVAYPIADQLKLQDYSDKWWMFALVPGWQKLKGKTLADVAAWQYYQCNSFIADDLVSIDTRRIFSVKFEDFVQEPVKIVQQVFEWAELSASQVAAEFARILPRVNDAAPRASRSTHTLRFSKVVYAAIERLPELVHLQKRMGYESTVST
jgi:Sulfotransferase family